MKPRPTSPEARTSAVRLGIELIALAGFCFYLFYFGLGSFGLIGADEPRYAQVAREMLARRDWITPVLNGQPWLEKPVLYYWGAMVSYAVFGVSDLAARIPSAVSATFMVFGSYAFMRRFRPGVQLDAALIVASSAGIIGFSRAASTDMPLAATLTLSMLAWFTWFETGRNLWLAIFYVFLALATLAKGPVAPVLAFLILVAFLALGRQWIVLAHTLWWPGILIGCAVALPWYVLVQIHNPEFFRVFLLEHNLARYGTNMFRHPQPFWYFVPVALLGLLPWTVYAFTALVRGLRPSAADTRNHSPAFGLFFACWAVVPVIFFSFSQSKLPGYILPALPPFAILFADYLRATAQPGKRAPMLLTVLHSALASALLGAALLVQFFVLRIPPPAPALWTSGIVTVMVFAGMLAGVRLRGLRVLRFVTLVPVVFALVFVIKVGGPILDSRLSSRPLVHEITALHTGNAPVAVFQLSRELEYGLDFYLNRPIADYARGIPTADHLVVAPAGSAAALQRATGRRVSHIGEYSPQHLELFWISNNPAPHRAD